MEPALVHPFPLIRGGGLFLCCVGLGLLLGWRSPRLWVPLAVAGFVAGGVASALSPALPPRLGAPSALQIGALVGAIVFEVAAIAYVVRRFQDDERTQILSVLLVVGAHFVIMGLSHGPLMALLGAASVANAWAGLRLLPHVALERFGVFDALLKIGFGLWMLLFFPAWGYPGLTPPL